MGEDFVVWVKKESVKKYLTENGIEHGLLAVLYGDYFFSRRWYVIANAFKEDGFAATRVIPGKIIWAYITAGRYNEGRDGYMSLIGYFDDIFDMFAPEDVMVVGDYTDFSDPEYVSLVALANDLEIFLRDSVKDYSALLH